MRLALFTACALLFIHMATVAAPNVSGNVISWPDDGWYQVQDESDYAEVCAGGSSCEVGSGSYVVINHSTGERFPGIQVGDVSTPITVTGNTISWPDDGWYQVQRADTYESVCGGGLSCVVPDGTYIVINHSTGMRYTGITVPTGVSSPITVSGNTISWPDNGWYQVQRSDTYESVCSGVLACDVESGTYIVINHTTGERFTVIVEESDLVFTEVLITDSNEFWYCEFGFQNANPAIRFLEFYTDNTGEGSGDRTSFNFFWRFTNGVLVVEARQFSFILNSQRIVSETQFFGGSTTSETVECNKMTDTQ